ncbi:hypothetical protein EVAR_93250_1 [Eumeta japonica]|uniref:Uncharacterized protein n=1 Tax=Eumeta variegata TaxID=151549 RepID=A0A4C1TXP8_EUMVA|nr:hypothetical protein EVAR_93250_1 [Eumeta japonica]
MHFRRCPVRPSYRYLMEKYNLLDLSCRRLQRDAQILYDLYHNEYDCAALIGTLRHRFPYRAQRRIARPRQLFASCRCRITTGARSPMRSLVDIYKTLNNKRLNPIEIVASAVGSFKKKKKKFISTLNSPFDD